MHCIYIVLVLCILTGDICFAQQSCENVDDELVNKVTDLENADFIFAGLFPISNQGCKGYHEEKGVERMEAMIRAVQLINEDNDILSGIKIGYDMRDTCSQETSGVEASISLVQPRCDTGNMSGIPIGVIGAASSSVSVPTASFFRVFNIPQISYASSSPLLSDTNRYNYFFRTVAPDNFQVTAMVDIFNNYGWRLVNALFTQSAYGTPGAEALARAVEANNETCLDVESAVPEYDGESLRALASRVATSQANVVVCFCTSRDANRIITAVRDYIITSMPNRTRIVWIASNAWSTSIDAVSGVEEFADGLLGLGPLSEEYTEYTDYFTSISPYNITNDLWFCGYFSQVYNCTYNTTNSNKTICSNSIKEAATSNDKPYQQNAVVPFIYDATYAMANALDSVLRQKCTFPYNISDNMCKNSDGDYTEVGGETLRDALYKVNFTGTIRDFVFFDSSGDGQAKYSIYTYNYRDVMFQQVGLWDASMKGNELNLSGYNLIDNVTSYCGGIAPCDPGYKTNYQVGSSQCCWTCDPCHGGTYSVGSFRASCDTCPTGEWGNNPLESNTACFPIEPRFLNYNVWWTWIFLVISIGGLIGWLVVSIIYLGNWTHRVVRYSGREHCVLMLIGAGLCFLLAFFTIAKPLIITCVIWSLLYWLSLSLLIFPLLMKIIRIVRIFISKQNIHTKRFISWHWQIVFSLIPVGIVLLIVLISFSTKPDIVETLQFDNALATPTYQLQCDDAHDAFIITLYSIFILSVVVLLFFAVLTRTYPKNYRESVHIMYSSFSLIVIMFVNVIVFFVLPTEFAVYRRLVQNICLMLIAATILLAFFGPRLFLLLFRRDAKDEETNVDTNATEAEEREKEFMKTLGKKYPDILDPFAKYTKDAGNIQDNSLDKSGEGTEDKDNSMRKEPL